MPISMKSMAKLRKRIKKIMNSLKASNPVMWKLITRLQEKRQRLYFKKYCLSESTDEKLVFFESFIGKHCACSPRGMYEAMLLDHRYDEYRFVWSSRRPLVDRLNMANERTSIVKYNSRAMLRAMGRAKFWVTNWRWKNSVIRKDDQILIQTWHGTPLKRIGCDAINVDNVQSSKKEQIRQYTDTAKLADFFVSPSRFCSDRYITAFGFGSVTNPPVIVETGYPRNDELFSGSKEKVWSIKKMLGIPCDKKVILYAPTWRDNQNELGKGYTFDAMSIMEEFLSSLPDDYVVLMRLHYLVASRLDLTGYSNVVDVSSYDNVNDLYIISDILITDYSSVFFDFAVLGRPIIFYMFDYDQYKNTLRGFYIDIEKESPGPIVKTQQELLLTVLNISDIQIEYQKRYLDFNAKYNYLDDANSGIRAVDSCIGRFDEKIKNEINTASFDYKAAG